MTAVVGFVEPVLDFHALAPLIVLAGTIVVLLVADLFFEERTRWVSSTIAGTGLLLAALPVLTLAVAGHDRSMFGGAFVVDDFALVLTGLFLLGGYVVVLLSVNYVGEGDYYEGEYYFMLLSALLGMVLMASARDLITIFIALELLSLPAYLLAGWRKRDPKSNEAAVKYFLLGVFATAVMLYGMSLVFGFTGTTVLADIGALLGGSPTVAPAVTFGIVLVLIGFAFKVSAVPFHQWAPDTYEGAPTPITAFLSVASKAAGFAAILQLVFVGFLGREDVWGPFFWVLAAATMTIGNLIALRQTNIVRMLAYSSVAQGGFMLVPLGVVGLAPEVAGSAMSAIVTYLLIYAVMNLGAFAVVITVARKTRSGEISSYGGLFEYAPGLAVVMTIFLFSLAGIPPLAGWFAKLVVFRVVLEAGTAWAIVLGVVTAVNVVIALFYYAAVAREMWMRPVPDADRTPIRVPPSLGFALGLTVVGTLVWGVLPQFVGRLGDLARFEALQFVTLLL